jgi:hypothetical protein
MNIIFEHVGDSVVVVVVVVVVITVVVLLFISPGHVPVPFSVT